MTYTVAEGLRVDLGQLPQNWIAHPEGIKGALAVAGVIFLLRCRKNK